jgi:hypothetical protein
MKTIRTIFITGLLISSPTLAETPVATTPMTKAQMRERLATCSAQWQQMKRRGAEGTLIWREFSEVCMSQTAGSPGTSAKKTNARNENAPPAR